MYIWQNYVYLIAQEREMLLRTFGEESCIISITCSLSNRARTFVNTIMNIWAPRKEINFSCVRGNLTLPRRASVNEVV